MKPKSPLSMLRPLGNFPVKLFVDNLRLSSCRESQLAWRELSISLRLIRLSIEEENVLKYSLK
jgi:hypothetical protein